MQPGINVEDIRKYNSSLREYQDKYNKINAEIEFNKRELQKLCGELSAELGIQVTPDNIVEIYNERVAKINNTLSIGTEILQRIKSEESLVAQNQQQAASQIGQAGQMGAGPVQSQSTMPPIQPTVASQPAPGPITPPNLEDLMSGGLPPIFSNRQ